MNPPRGHELRDHTADVILEAWAPTPEACLEEAARGLCSVYGAAPEVDSRLPFTVSVADPDDLVPIFLEEILFALDTADDVPVGAEVHEVTSTAVSGWILLASRDSVEVVGPGPKAVARTDARLERDGGSWRCRVTIDV